jgi:hypothetical protein
MAVLCFSYSDSQNIPHKVVVLWNKHDHGEIYGNLLKFTVSIIKFPVSHVAINNTVGRSFGKCLSFRGWDSNNEVLYIWEMLS